MYKVRKKTIVANAYTHIQIQTKHRMDKVTESNKMTDRE